MKPPLGLGIALAVAVAALRVQGGPGPSADRAAVPPPASSAHHRRANVIAPDLYQGCTAFLAAPAEAEERYPHDSNRGAAKSVVDRFFGLGADGKLTSLQGVHFAIALVPDPRHTNLSLTFDREMVAIQQAAQDEGYTYDTSWLPWQTESHTFARMDDEQRASDETDQREACPGVLLFRRSVREQNLAPQSTGSARPSQYAPAPWNSGWPYDHALVVLVVGEQPTAGINQTQWSNALTWLGESASPGNAPVSTPRVLRILGPSFSGSLVSLERNLAALPRAPNRFPSAATPIAILSGMVSSCSSARWFEQRIKALRPSISEASAGISFGSFTENDELQIYRFLNYLKVKGTDTQTVAIVSEDETAYANPPSHEDAEDRTGTPAQPSPCEFPYALANRPLHLSYPRDISALRHAYEQQSVFASASSEHSAHPILQETQTKEGGTSEPSASDTIQSFSGSVTPVAEEAILYGIVSFLRAHHSHYIVLRSTNPLDFIFLSRFFHRAYPEGRVVTVGSDLLFRREIDTTEFRGVLALSSYPLLSPDQHWTYVSQLQAPPPDAPHTHRVIDSQMEGDYLAGRYVFSVEPKDARADALQLPYKENLPNFADPFWMHNSSDPLASVQAPTWLAVVGRDGYWPVAVLNDRSTPHGRLDCDDPQSSRSEHGANPLKAGCNAASQAAPPSTLVKIDGARVHYDLEPGEPNRFRRSLLFGMPLPLWIAIYGSMVLLGYQIFGVWFGARFTSSGLLALFRRSSMPSQAVLLGINSAVALGILIEMLWAAFLLPSVGLVYNAEDYHGIFIGLGVIALAALLIGLLKHGASKARKRNGLLSAASFAVVVLLIGGAFAGALIYRSGDRVPVFYRAAHLFSGVSPLVPVLFLLVGFYLWTWQATAGNSLLCHGRPLLPNLREAPPVAGQMRRLYDRFLGIRTVNIVDGDHLLTRSEYRLSSEMEKRIVRAASPLSIEPRVLLVPGLLLFGALRFISLYGPPLLSLENAAFALYVNLALLGGFLITTAEAGRLFFSWIELRRLLSALNRQRLRRTLAKLRAISSSSLWSVSGDVQRIQYLFFSQQIDAASRLCVATHDATPASAYGPDRIMLPRTHDAVAVARAFASVSAAAIGTGPLWGKAVMLDPHKHNTILLGPSAHVREVFNDAVGEVFNTVLLPAWRREEDSLNLETRPGSDEKGEVNAFDMELSKDPAVKTGEEFVCLHYISFIQNILGRMRTMILSMVFLFVSVCFAISFYPFVPRTQIVMWMMVNLVFIAASVIYVYAGMARDETLSYITNTTVGRLDAEFYVKTASFLAGPVIGLLTTQFPSISESVLGWLQPGLDSLK